MVSLNDLNFWNASRCACPESVQKKDKKLLTLSGRFEILPAHTEIQTSHMRTKTLLLTAALVAAGAATSMAQNVYSVNAVGYVNTSILPGFQMISNPLKVSDNSLQTLIPTAPDQTSVYTFSGGAFSAPYTYYTDLGGWDPAGGAIAFGDGVFLYAPSAFTITFVGEVEQGAPIHNAYPAGFSIKSSKVPQQANLTALGLAAPADQTSVYPFDASSQAYQGPYTYYVDLGGWDPADPTIGIGQAFWLNSPSAGDWTRTFSVN